MLMWCCGVTEPHSGPGWRVTIKSILKVSLKVSLHVTKKNRLLLPLQFADSRCCSEADWRCEPVTRHSVGPVHILLFCLKHRALQRYAFPWPRLHSVLTTVMHCVLLTSGLVCRLVSQPCGASVDQTNFPQEDAGGGLISLLWDQSLLFLCSKPLMLGCRSSSDSSLTVLWSLTSLKSNWLAVRTSLTFVSTTIYTAEASNLCV